MISDAQASKRNKPDSLSYGGGADIALSQTKCPLLAIDDVIALEGSLVSVPRAQSRVKHAATRLPPPTITAHILEEEAQL
jgi:hypothetical protein